MSFCSWVAIRAASAGLRTNATVVPNVCLASALTSASVAWRLVGQDVHLGSGLVADTSRPGRHPEQHERDRGEHESTKARDSDPTAQAANLPWARALRSAGTG